MIYQAELTDTFGGQANYCWVRRATFSAPADASTRTLLLRARKALRLSYSFRTAWQSGDLIRADAKGSAICLFISPAD